MSERIIAVGCLKGGTGKTTIAVNLACELTSGRRPVAVVDADQQQSASAWIAHSAFEPVSCHTLPLEDRRHAGAWMQSVRDIAADYVVIDLPPHIGAATEAALMVADLLLVPVTPSPLDIHAAGKVLALLHEAREARGGRPACLLVPSKVDRRTAAGQGAEVALKRLGERVAPAVCQRSAFVNSSVAGSWVGSYAPSSVAHEEITRLARAVRAALS